MVYQWKDVAGGDPGANPWHPLPFDPYTIKITGTTAKVGGLTNGLTYEHRVTSKNSGGESAPTDFINTLLPPDAPTGLSSTTDDGTITLTWNDVAYDTGYVVYRWSATAPGEGGQQGGWVRLPIQIRGTTAAVGGLTNGVSYQHGVRSWTLPTANLRGTQYDVEIQAQGGSWASTRIHSSATSPLEIDLDDIIGPIGDGLADADAYEIRIKATRGSVSALSETIQIIDSPIMHASGASPPGGGEIHIKWTAIPGASGGRYAIRIANLNRVTSLGLELPKTWISETSWRPPPMPAFPPSREQPLIDPDSSPEMIVSSLPGSGRLPVGKDIYAVQLVYGPTTVDAMGNTTIQPRIFSARDVYVWPSNAPPQRPNLPDGDPLEYERIATYAFFGHHANKTYSYRVCNSPYLSEGTKYNDWVALIDAAMRQWELATQIITTSRETSTECADLVAVDSPFGGGPWNVIEQERLNDNQSEIRVVNVPATLAAIALGAMPTDIYQACLVGAKAACVTSRPGYSDPERHAGKAIPSADISFKESYLREPYAPPDSSSPASGSRDDFNRPMSVRFNKCFPDDGTIYDVYETTLHEIGHALGLSNAGDPVDYVFNYGPFDQYVISHPTITDSVMNYEGQTVDEPDCSPHPFDVMAIYAIYQNLPW